MKENDKRATCCDEKRAKIRASLSSTYTRRKFQVVRCLELKIDKAKLNKKQKEELERLFLEGKWFYNHVLEMKNHGRKLADISTTDIKEVKHFDKDKNPLVSELTTLGSQHKRGIVKQMVANEKTIRKLVERGFQRHGKLKFKKELNAIPLPQHKVTYVFRDSSHVRIAGISGRLRVKTGGQLDNADELANAVLLRKPDGYYLNVTAYFNEGTLPNTPCNGKELGIDFGISNNLTTSDGEVVNVQIGESEHLKVLQRKLARQIMRSNNWKRTQREIDIAYQKITNKKQEAANQFVHRMKAYKVIVIQDEQLKKWHQDKKKGYSKVVQHSCMGTIKAKLKNLSNVIVLDEYIPTTKWCPQCGGMHDEITLDDREFVCECGRKMDRDVHSANNMLSIAHLVLGEDLVPVEHREIKRVEFLASADGKSETVKHEAANPSGWR